MALIWLMYRRHRFWYVSWAIRRYSFLVNMRKRCRRRFHKAKVSDLPSPERCHISSSGFVEATDIALARIPRYCRSQRRSWCHHPGSGDLGRIAGKYRDRYPHGSFCKLQPRAIPQVRSWIRKLARGTRLLAEPVQMSMVVGGRLVNSEPGSEPQLKS